MDKTKPSTCTRCRTKKIASIWRCDGEDPCGPCSRARTDVKCNYTSQPNPIYGPELRKGAACSACRRKKKRCSGDWPCRACITSKKEDDCKYDDSSQLSFTRALIERTRELEQLLSEAKQTHEAPGISNYALPPALSAELDELLPNSLPASDSISPAFYIGQPKQYPSLSDSLNITDIVTSVSSFPEKDAFSLHPLAKQVEPTSIVPPNIVLVAESASEKLFRIRLLFLQRSSQFGFSMSANKLDAIARGDLTGTIVHPVLVYVSQLWGYLLDYQNQNQSWFFIPDKNEDEVTQMRLILGSINGMLDPVPNPVTCLEAYLRFQPGPGILAVASSTAMTNDIDLACLAHFSCETGNADPYSVLPRNDAEEMRAAFSHLIFVGLDSELILKVPQVVDARLTDKFRVLMDTHLITTVDTNFMRAKSVRLLTDTRRLTSTWNNPESEQGQNPSVCWLDEYWKLIEQIHEHLGRLKPAQLRVSFVPDSHITDLGLKVCSIVSLAALADLHGIFAPSHAESSRRYRDTICWMVATKKILENEVIYENQESIIAVIRECNQKLYQALPYVNDY
ncbi:hypothetical protein B0H10DRAFT_1939002 [Mycena sp. CBHHK59/15]|nr:hypothetical protein B0H10DRAFT_1939002 [Mycena sp. CBHHK59/15]